jgi:hypothetical protein
MQSAHYPCQISMKAEFWRRVLEKNIQIAGFIKILSAKAELFRTDRHDEANSLFPPVCERA